MAVSADPSELRSVAAAKERLELLAWFLDSAVRVPGTSLRVGADAILNVVPGIGPLAAKALSAYLIWEAHRLGVPPSTLVRMLGNVGVDLVLSAIPLLGWVGDAFWRANLRNMLLLRGHIGRCEGSAAGLGSGLAPFRGVAGQGACA